MYRQHSFSFRAVVILLFPITIFLVTCGDKKKDDGKFTDESIKNVIHLSNGKVYNNDNLFLGYPMRLEFHPDSFLIILDFSTQKLVKIIDLKTNTIQEQIQKGRGPGEILVGWGLKVVENEIFTFCGQLRKVIRLKPGPNRWFEISDEFEIEDKHAIEFYPISIDQFVCLSVISEERLTFLDGKGQIINKMGDFPPFKSSQYIKPDNDIFQATITGSPDGKRIAIACKHTDIIDIYDLESKKTNRVQGPLGIDITVTDMGIAKSIDPRYSTYTILVASEKEFWASFNGFKHESGVVPSTQNQFPKQIYCFDWTGKPIRKLILDFPFGGFTVDWTNRILYAIEIRDNLPIIVEYELDEYLM